MGPTTLLAGMPSFTLDDLAAMRLQSISFFLLIFFLSAAAIMWSWNVLRRDFPRVPRLSYGRALALVGLWGLFFILVLTMISGARELLTPGAWERSGATYRLSKDSTTSLNDERRERLLSLKAALWEYAKTHDGAFPASADSGEIPAAVWETSEISGVHFNYLPGGKVNGGSGIVAYEPAVFPPPRLALTSDGHVISISDEQLKAALTPAKASP